MSSSDALSILHILLAVRETSAPYNEHCLPWAGKRDIAICTYFGTDIAVPKTIDLFEGDGSVTGFLRVLSAALDAKEYDVIHIHSPHLGLLFLLATAPSYRKFASSTIITVHDSYPNYKLRNRLMFIPVFATFQSIVCCSRASHDSFPPFFRKLAGNRLRIVQNGLDIARVDRVGAAISPRRQTNDFTIVAISRLVEIKNPFSVLAAFQQSGGQSSRLIYIGHGPLRDQLLAKSNEANIQNRVTFTGLIPREKVFEYLLSADLFISMSRGEGLPVSVLEAMACRCPVLLSDIPPHREIAEGVDFIPLIQPDDVVGFSQAIQNFRDMSIAERVTIGEKCRKLVEQRLSLSAMHAQYDAIYAQLAGKQVSSSLKATT